MLRLLEHYPSIQGEGPRTGTPTQFVRFAGCNLRCPGWPCDTPQSIFPDQYIDVMERLTATELMARIHAMYRETGTSNICITGGEPFLQTEKDLLDLLGMLMTADFSLEVFTNGTLRIPPPWLATAQINMDWKLNGSGEGQRNHDQRLLNVRGLKPTDMIKFVVKDWEDVHQAEEVSAFLREDGLFKGEFWVGAAFGHIEPHELVAHILRYASGWKLNVQLHKYIWSPDRTLV